MRLFLVHRHYMISSNTYCLEEYLSIVVEGIYNQFTQYNFAYIDNFFTIQKIPTEHSIVIYEFTTLLNNYRLFSK
jgi:hypothetical protein